MRDIASGKETPVAKVKNGLERYAATEDASLVITARKDQLGFFSGVDGKPAFPAVTTASPVLDMSRPYLNDTRIATGHEKGVIRVWDLKSGQKVEEYTLAGAEEFTHRLRVAEDGVAAVIANKDGTQKLVDWQAKKLVTWAKSQPSSGLVPIPGGLVYYPTPDSTAKTSGLVYQVVVRNLAGGNFRYKLEFPAAVPRDIVTEFTASGDGQRFFAHNPQKATVVVWDLPKK